MAYQRLVFSVCCANTRDWLLGDDKHMRRCGRIDVSERQHLIILEDYVSGDVTLNDFFKQSHADWQSYACTTNEQSELALRSKHSLMNAIS